MFFIGILIINDIMGRLLGGLGRAFDVVRGGVGVTNSDSGDSIADYQILRPHMVL